MKKFIILLVALIIGTLGIGVGTFVSSVNNYDITGEDAMLLYCTNDNSSLIRYDGAEQIEGESDYWYIYESIDNGNRNRRYGKVRSTYADSIAKQEYDNMIFIEKLAFINNK